jgi:hypothetical protein
MTVNLARNGDVSVAYETAGPAEGVPLLLINGMGRSCCSGRPDSLTR